MTLLDYYESPWRVLKAKQSVMPPRVYWKMKAEIFSRLLLRIPQIAEIVVSLSQQWASGETR